MSFLICNKCGRLLSGFDRAIGYCNPCHTKHKKEYTILREYLKTHPNASIMDVVNGTLLPLPSINKMIEEEKISVRSQYKLVR